MSDSIHVYPTVKDGVRLVNLTRESVRLYPSTPPSGSTTSYLNNVRGRHNRSVITHNRFVDGWRDPAAYRCFAAKVDGYAYAFKCTPTASFPADSIWLFTSSETDRQGGMGPSGGYDLWGTWGPATSPTPDVGLSIVNQAITECLNKINDSRLSLSENLAEASKTIDQAASLVTTICRSFLLARKGHWAQAFRVLMGSKAGERTRRAVAANFGNYWLAWNYGVKPLVSDIRMLYALATTQTKNLAIAAKRTVTQDYGTPGRPSSYIGGFWQSRGTSKIGCEVKIWAQLDSARVSYLKNLGLDNPFVLGWELLPFSFVIDWLIPVSNSLDALSAAWGVTFKCGYQTIKSWSDFTIQSLKPLYIKNFSGIMPFVRYKNVCMVRTVLDSMPFPRLYIKSPFSTSHVATAIALIAQTKIHRGRNADIISSSGPYKRDPYFDHWMNGSPGGPVSNP